MNTKKTIVTFLIILLSVTTIYGLIQSFRKIGVQNSGLPSKMEVFISVSGKFSILYPSNWVATETPYGNHGDMTTIVIIGNPGFGTSYPRIEIARKEFFDQNIENVKEWGISQKMRFGFIEETDLELRELNSENTIVYEYLYHPDNASGEKIKRCLDYYVFYDTWGYVFNFCSDNKQWEGTKNTFIEMIESISFIE